MRDFPIDKTLNKILGEAEERFKDQGISRDQIKEAFYFYFRNAADLMKSFDFPTVVFPKWGRYAPMIHRLKRLSDRLEEPAHKDQVDEAIERLEYEKHKRKRK